MSPAHLGCMALAMLVATPMATAQTLASPSASTAVPYKALAPAQINAIRSIGRNVLAAKKSAQDDASDAQQLDDLRSTVDQLLTAEFDQPRISLLGQSVRTETTDRRVAGRAQARALAMQLRERHGRRANEVTQVDLNATETTSAGLPVGRQRAELFVRTADKLEAAIGEDSNDRVARLRELQQQLNAGRSGLHEAPLQAQTPTLQAMPGSSLPASRRGTSPSSATGKL